jgi:hypothetical protein
MMCPLVVDLAAEGVAVVTRCRVLGFSTAGVLEMASPADSESEWVDAHLADQLVDLHADDPCRVDRRRVQTLKRLNYESLRDDALPAEPSRCKHRAEGVGVQTLIVAVSGYAVTMQQRRSCRMQQLRSRS